MQKQKRLNQLKRIKMETQKYMKIQGFWRDENLGIKLVGCIYYLKPENFNAQFVALQTKIRETKHQFFDIKIWDYVNLPYKPANTIKILY